MRTDITLQEIVAELRRELGMREAVYGRQVEQGKLRPSVAEQRTAIIRLLLQEKEAALAEEEKLSQPSLFGEHA